MMRSLARSLIPLLLLAPGSSAAEEPADTPSFVESGGLLNRGQHAVVLYLDAELLAPPVTVGYRHGVLRWLELGLDVGANTGLLQVLAHTRLQLLQSASRRLFWGLHLRSGYKTHHFSIGETVVADDTSWVTAAEHCLGLRLGQARRHVLYLETQVYVDIDLRTPRRQTDYYLAPASLGYEAMITRWSSVFVELGFVISLNGTETHAGLLYEGDLFPMGQVGAAVRFQ